MVICKSAFLTPCQGVGGIESQMIRFMAQVAEEPDGGVFPFSVINYGRYNHYCCTVSAVEVSRKLEKLTTLSLYVYHHHLVYEFVSHHSVFPQLGMSGERGAHHFINYC